ncbi:hypothetical protein V8G54_021495 [Vigna mungo]|uniref:Uncharacterized protein n=1 Tax=Vigna mungo TaxID=3915 RepID=A0AAQ3RXE7_VIGMU
MTAPKSYRDDEAARHNQEAENPRTSVVSYRLLLHFPLSFTNFVTGDYEFLMNFSVCEIGVLLQRSRVGTVVETVFDGSKLGIEPYAVEVLPDGDFLILESIADRSSWQDLLNEISNVGKGLRHFSLNYKIDTDDPKAGT